MFGGLSASIFGSAIMVIYAPASRAQEQSNTNDVIAKLESAAKYHPAESVVLDLFEQMDNSNDPVLNYRMARAMEAGRLLCLNVVDGVVEHACTVPNSNNSYDQSTNNEETERLRQLLLRRQFKYMAKAAALGYAAAQYDIGLQLAGKKQAPDSLKGFESVTSVPPIEWMKLAERSGFPEAATYMTAVRAAVVAAKKQKNQEKKRQLETMATKPHCTTVRFSGLAVGGATFSLEVVRSAKDIDDVVARNPLRCAPSNFTYAYTCFGAAILVNRPAFIISWAKNWLMVLTPVDLTESGRHDVMVFIDRDRAACANNLNPATTLADNLTSFWQSGRSYN